MAYFHSEETHGNLLAKINPALSCKCDTLVDNFWLGPFSFGSFLLIAVTVIGNNRQNFMGYLTGLMSNEVS